jgi:hypothetical protein
MLYKVGKWLRKYTKNIIILTKCKFKINQKEGGTEDDQGKDGGTNYILRIKEQETRLIRNEHDNDDDDDDDKV